MGQEDPDACGLQGIVNEAPGPGGLQCYPGITITRGYNLPDTLRRVWDAPPTKYLALYVHAGIGDGQFVDIQSIILHGRVPPSLQC